MLWWRYSKIHRSVINRQTSHVTTFFGIYPDECCAANISHLYKLCVNSINSEKILIDNNITVNDKYNAIEVSLLHINCTIVKPNQQLFCFYDISSTINAFTTIFNFTVHFLNFVWRLLNTRIYCKLLTFQTLFNRGYVTIKMSNKFIKNIL